jgi:hypothetical protein
LPGIRTNTLRPEHAATVIAYDDTDIGTITLRVNNGIPELVPGSGHNGLMLG